MTFADAMHRLAVVPKRKCSVCSRAEPLVYIKDNYKVCEGCNDKASVRLKNRRLDT